MCLTDNITRSVEVSKKMPVLVITCFVLFKTFKYSHKQKNMKINYCKEIANAPSWFMYSTILILHAVGLPLIILSHTPSPNKGVFKPFKPLERMFGEQTLEGYR